MPNNAPGCVPSNGRYVVIGKNFPLGTSQAGFCKKWGPVGGVILNCRIVIDKPSVTAEVTFQSKEGADKVVNTFNGLTVRSSWEMNFAVTNVCFSQAGGNVTQVCHARSDSNPVHPAIQHSIGTLVAPWPCQIVMPGSMINNGVVCLLFPQTEMRARTLKSI